METVTVNIDNNMIALLEKFIENEIYPNKSECIRAATRNLLLYHRKMKINPKIKSDIFITNGMKKDLLYNIENKLITNNQTNQEFELTN